MLPLSPQLVACRFILTLSLTVAGGLVGSTALAAPASQAPNRFSSQATASIPLNSSALLLDRRLLEAGPKIVQRIARLGDRRLMIVVSMHCRLNESLQPIELGLMTDRTESWTSLRNFEPLNNRLLKEYRQLLAVTFAEAVKQRLDICVMLHLDSIGEIHEWRNLYDFDPLAAIGPEAGRKYSYEKAVVDSVVVAIKKSVPAGSKIQFSLAGEMGRSVFAYPRSYRKIVRRVSDQLASYELELGVSLNHNDIAGGLPMNRSAGNESVGNEADRLIDSLNFVGYSHYRPFTMPIAVKQFEEVKDDFVRSLLKRGVTLSKKMPLHLSEVAVGGAPNQHGLSSTGRAAAEPWEGTNNPLHNPWKQWPMIQLRRTYHDTLMGFLSKPTKTNPITAAYLWSEGSWDPLGVYSRHFVDAAIKESVQLHNAK